ncbi:MAG TPA: hypothetical protein VK961_09670, partial [Chthoniobacter sp.]|nr:hypothetical protein [Chthoniobacter sp.]
MHFPQFRKVASVLCATFFVIPAVTFAGEMMKYTKQNFAISLPDTWEDVTDVNPSKGLIAFFLATDRKRMVLVFRDDKVPPAGELDERFMEEYEKSIGVTGGNKRLTGKLVFVQGVKSYERTGVGEWRQNSVSTWSRTIPAGDHFYLLRGMIWNGGKADEDPQIFESMDSFRFLTPPPPNGSGTAAAPSISSASPSAPAAPATATAVPMATPAPAPT